MTGTKRLWSRIQQHEDAAAPHSGHAASVHGTRHSAGGADPLDGYYASTIHAARHSPGGADSLSTFYETTKVSNLRGRSVQDAAPTNTQVLTWDNANAYWKPSAASGGAAGSTVTWYTITGSSGGDFSTTSTSFVDITGCTLTFTATAGAKQMAWLRGIFKNSGTGSQTEVALNVDGGDQADYAGIHAPVGAYYVPFAVQWNGSLPSGSRIIKGRCRVDSGTGAVINSDGTWTLTIMEST
mgnify:CR=1 FL=1